MTAWFKKSWISKAWKTIFSFPKRNVAAWLRFASGTMSCGQIKPKWTFGHKAPPLAKPTHTAYQQKHLIPIAKRSNRGVVICGCFSAIGPGQLAIIELTVNFTVNRSILESNVRNVWKNKRIEVLICVRTLRELWMKECPQSNAVTKSGPKFDDERHRQI